MINYLLGDMVNRVKMSIAVSIPEVLLFNNRIIIFILNLLLILGYIYNFYAVNFKYLKAYIFFHKAQSVIRQVYIISRPGLKVYTSLTGLLGAKIQNYISFFSFSFVSSSNGLATDLECKILYCGGEFMINMS